MLECLPDAGGPARHRFGGIECCNSEGWERKILGLWHSGFNPPEADEGLIRPLGRLRWFPIDTPAACGGEVYF